MKISPKLSFAIFVAALSFGVVPLGARAASTNAATLSVGLVPGFPGATAQVPIFLGTTGTAVAAQFELNYSPAHLQPGSIGPGNLDANAVVKWRQVSPGVLRYVVYSPQNTLFRTNQQIGSLPVVVATSETKGGQITPANALVAAADGSLVTPVGLTQGGVLVQPIFVVSDGSVDLMFHAQPNETYIVQATTNFVNWVNISTNTALLNYFTLTDYGSVGLPYRFYRAVPIAFAPPWQLSAIARQTNGAVSFQVSGGQGATFVVQASTNLANWVNLATNSIATGPVPFTDAGAGLFPVRFYRVLVLP